MLNALQEQVREFCHAARNPYSYNLLHNIYIWFGIFWGLPVPVVTIFMQITFISTDPSANALLLALQTPLQWFFLAHPLLFASLFGILGTIRFEKDRDLTEKIQQLNELTIHDPLTGLKNRRYFTSVFHDECARSLRRREPLSLLFLDIDHFKKINDRFGHHHGDVVLRELGKYLHQRCRPYDTPVRWGGEEFLLLLRATDEHGARDFSERIRRGVESGLSEEITTPLTVSIGLAQYMRNDTIEHFTDRADQALYHAKQLGRNRVVSWSDLLAFRRDAKDYGT